MEAFLGPNLLGNDVDPLLILAGVLGTLAVVLGLLAATAKPDAPGPRGIFAALGIATRVFVANAGPLVLMAAVVGGIGAVLSSWVGTSVHDYWMHSHPTNNPQVALMASELPNSLVVLLWGCTAGAFAAAFSLYYWVRFEKKETGSLYAGVNYALSRLPRVFPAHAKAYGLIWLGNIVIIPGIWFALQYAFVDAIATLDDREKDPLGRSQRLTFGRRGRIFRTYAVLLVWMLPYQLPLRFAFQDKGLAYVALGGTIDECIAILLTFAFVQYFLDIFRKAKTDDARPAAVPG